MKKITISVFIFLSFFAINIASAQKLADVNISEQISVDGVDAPLILNGAGIRSKFFFKIYVGALYLPKKQNNAEAVLKSTQPNRVLMHFLYDEVEKKKLVDAWIEGFEENVSSKVFSALKDRLKNFNAMFSDVHKGDVILLDYIPQKGTRVTIRNEVKGIIEGADFNRALLSVWLGEEPVTDELKNAMLGIIEED